MTQASSNPIATINDSGFFDADWYRTAYPDVEFTGMEPGEHYLRYGHRMNRDPGPGFSTLFARIAYGIKDEHEPLGRLASISCNANGAHGPNPARVLKAANQVAERGDHARAIALAEAHLSPELAHTNHILRANAAVARADIAGWERHLNAYLVQLGVAPIRLEGSGTVFDRLTGTPLPPVIGGPLISVIMPAWNAEATVRKAALSILDQTWRNLELLIVDDASADGTWAVLQDIAAKDSRVKIARNALNLGPYVSNNIALSHVTGDFVTGQDADDWSLPQRLERHAAYMLETADHVGASMSRMLRMRPNGQLSNIKFHSNDRIDGVLQKASISCMFRREILLDRLGSWDCVRFGGDSELIKRAEIVLQSGFKIINNLSMLCLDLESSLTNHVVYGISKVGGLSRPRLEYREAYLEWHRQNINASDQYKGAFLNFPPITQYRTHVPEEARVDFDAIRDVLRQSIGPVEAGQHG